MSVRYFSTFKYDVFPWANAQPFEVLGSALENGIGPSEVVFVGFPPSREAPHYWRESLAHFAAQGAPGAPARLSFGRVIEGGSIAPSSAKHAPYLRMSRAGFPTQNRAAPLWQAFHSAAKPTPIATFGPEL